MCQLRCRFAKVRAKSTAWDNGLSFVSKFIARKQWDIFAAFFACGILAFPSIKLHTCVAQVFALKASKFYNRSKSSCHHFRFVNRKLPMGSTPSYTAPDVFSWGMSVPENSIISLKCIVSSLKCISSSCLYETVSSQEVHCSWMKAPYGRAYPAKLKKITGDFIF